MAELLDSAEIQKAENKIQRKEGEKNHQRIPERDESVLVRREARHKPVEKLHFARTSTCEEAETVEAS